MQRIWRHVCIENQHWTPFIFRQLCIKNRPDSVLEITAWAQEHFQKSLSVNTGHRNVHKCRLELYHGEKKPNVDMIQKYHSLVWTKADCRCSVVRQIKISFFRNHWLCIFWTKVERNRVALNKQFKSLHLWWYGVPMELENCTSGRAPSMLKSIHRFQSNICSIQVTSFSGKALHISARQR